MSDIVPQETQPPTPHTPAAVLPTGAISDHQSDTIRLEVGKINTGTDRRYHVTLITSGDNDNGWVLPPDVLADALHRFAGAPCLLDHPGWFDFPSLQQLVGVYETPVFNELGDYAAITATLRLADTPPAVLFTRIFDAWLSDKQAGKEVAPIGLSAYMSVRFGYDDDNDRRVARAITNVWSVDAVLHPAAGGAVERVLNSQLPGGQTMPEEIVTTQATEAPAPPPPAPAVPSEPPAPTADPELLARIGALEASIATLTTALATREEPSVIQNMGTPRLFGGRSSLDQVSAAAEALLLGERPADGIAPLSGIRELYHLLSGDYEMTGLFRQDRVYLAAVTSATMAQICANALNKAVVNMFMQYPQWWAPIVTVVNFTNLQDARWITLGGVGELPTVAEGAAYTELTWDDQRESDAFVKKGGYLGITIEAIDKDDTGRIQAAPRALAQAAWLTLGKSVSAIFTASSGVGPTLDTDSTALFTTGHGNLGTTALSYAAWVATRTAMRKQTEVNSSERLGALTAPRFLLVPPDLEGTALTVLGSEGEPDTADNDVNPWSQGDGHDARLAAARRRIIVIDLWTDTNNWAAAADPRLYPSVGLGYRYGATPEIFSVASPTAGLMFTNDTMPVKVRYFYAVGPTDYRGLYKHNVA